MLSKYLSVCARAHACISNSLFSFDILNTWKNAFCSDGEMVNIHTYHKFSAEVLRDRMNSFVYLDYTDVASEREPSGSERILNNLQSNWVAGWVVGFVERRTASRVP